MVSSSQQIYCTTLLVRVRVRHADNKRLTNDPRFGKEHDQVLLAVNSPMMMLTEYSLRRDKIKR